MSLRLLFLLLFVKKQGLHVIQRWEVVNVFSRSFQRHAHCDLVFFHSFKPVRVIQGVKDEIDFLLARTVDQMLGQWSKYFDDSGQLVILWVPWENRNTYEELCTDTTQGPHVDCSIIWETKKDFWATIVSWLDILKDCKTFEACAAEIYDLKVWVLFTKYMNLWCKIGLTIWRVCFLASSHNGWALHPWLLSGLLRSMR